MTRPAASYRIPTATSLVSIEYPGPVSSSSSSIDQAVATLGGLHRLSRALASDNSASSSKIPNANNPDDATAATGNAGSGSGADAGVVELNFRPEHPFSHAIPGETVPANNWLVLKITKKRRRKRANEDEKDGCASSGVFKVEPVGSVSKVVRFRAMADIQYAPEGAEQDPTVQLATAMRTLDVEALQKYRFPEPTEDFEMGHDLKLLPPPVFSRLGLPQVYAYRKNPLSTLVTSTMPDGSEVTRLVNKNKYRGELITSVPFDTPTAELPQGPPAGMGPVDSKNGLESSLINKLHNLFEERPVWIRNALLNHLTKIERSRIQNAKVTLPFVCYTFSDGPYRESCIKFGYDPRLDKNARFYQRVMIRNMDNKRTYLKNIAGASSRTANDIRDKDSDESSHIFDGMAVHRNIGNYQLCDITEPYLAEAVLNEEWVNETCDPRDGWWDAEYFEYIRQVLRRKFFSLLNDGIQLPDEAFEDLRQHLRDYSVHLANNGGEVRRRGVSSRASAVPPSSRALQRQGSGNDDDGEYAEDGNEDRAMSEVPTAKKLVSLKHKGKRNVKPKARTFEDLDKSDKSKSRFSTTVEPESGLGNAMTQGGSMQDTIMEEKEPLQEEEQQ